MVKTSNLIQWFGPETGTAWDSTRVYNSTSETGSYTLLATVTPITTTRYWDEAGDSGTWYKVAFYDSVTFVEGSRSAAYYASGTPTMYTNPTELRKWMQFNVTDFPNDEDATLLLEQAHVQLAQDSGGRTAITDTGRLKLLALLLGSSYVCRSLAMRALSKGYVSVSLEGGSIMKAHMALMQMADYLFQKYQEQLAKDTVDFTITQYMPQIVGWNTLQDIKDIQNGVTNAIDYESQWMPSISNRTGRNSSVN